MAIRPRVLGCFFYIVPADQPSGVAITRQDTIDTTGMRVDEIVQRCYEQSPWDALSREGVCDRIVDLVVELVRAHKPGMPGLNQTIDVCQKSGSQLALASPSPMTLIQATINALDLHNVFPVIVSGAKLRYSKPHPEVYLNAADALEVQPQRCVALEDSFIGLLAAKAAQMKTIVIPEASAANQSHFAIADRQLATLGELTADLLNALEDR
ncbi:2-deoxyglucose-6-phosphate phosphatase [Stieleria maiorica]|uniref:2-deoxyglucose-6-phosphate phosphatase n=1 Tax=Stieleria maiorica TaxID=2795974 RepID=A0A5B9MAV9_9BACT|nr:hexitol phosphatase HxpB [Stieleria maiorica]QEF97843.1 2-deoxyglucose-6-phosphate phosphatase [Stieleria maiorica]